MNTTNVFMNYLMDSFEINIKRILKLVSNMDTTVNKKEMFYLTLGTAIYKALNARTSKYFSENLALYEKINELEILLPKDKMYLVSNTKLEDSEDYNNDDYVKELEKLRGIKYALNDEIDILISMYKENKRLKKNILFLESGIKKYYLNYPFHLEAAYIVPKIGYKKIC